MATGVDRTRVRLDCDTGEHVLIHPLDLRKLDLIAAKAQTRYRHDRYDYLVRRERIFHEVGGNVMKIEGRCECGKHRGVRFYQDDRLLSDKPLCPVSVWLAWYRQALDNGTWREFAEKRPLKNFVAQFEV